MSTYLGLCCAAMIAKGCAPIRRARSTRPHLGRGCLWLSNLSALLVRLMWPGVADGSARAPTSPPLKGAPRLPPPIVSSSRPTMQLPNAILGPVPPPSMLLGPPPPVLPLPVAKTPLPAALDPPKLTQAELDKKLIAAQMAKLDRENARPSSSTTKIPDLSKPNAVDPAKLPTHTPPPKVEPPRPPGGVPPPGPPATPVRLVCPAANLTMQDYRPMMMLLARQMPMHGAPRSRSGLTSQYPRRHPRRHRPRRQRSRTTQHSTRTRTRRSRSPRRTRRRPRSNRRRPRI